MENYVFGAGCFFLLLAAAGAFLLRRYLVRYTTNLISCVDDMIAGKKDITFDEENELLMAKVQVKLRQLYEILQSRTEQSLQDRERLEGLISDISHQIKIPVSNIRMYHEILKKRSLSKEQETQFQESLDRQIDKLNSLMESMTEISQMEVGMIQVEPAYQKVYPLIEQAVCSVSLKAEKKQMEMEIDCDSKIMAVYDLKWTLEALGNILDNAVKYTQACGKIKLTADIRGFFVRIKIEDTGKGIPEAHYTKIFKRFYREEEVQQEEGVGIGLYLAQEIARKQRGYIDVKSEVGKGSVFFMYLQAEL